MKLIAALLLSLSVPVLAQTPAQPPATAPATPLKAQLAKTPLSGVMLPDVNFDKAPVADAIDAFTTMVDTATKGAVKLQWIDNAFDRKTWKPTVTITAKGFSAAKLMSEILTQAGLEAKLENHAVVLQPKTRVVERRVIPAEKTEAPKMDSGAVERSPFVSPLKRK